MANTNAIAPRTTGLSLASVFGAVGQRLKAFSARNAAYNRTFNELGRLSDRELSDIGIARGMIHDIAQEEADRF